jgi:TetR/AcrR family transcriptional regulator, transcriptional repressor for nem operon
MSRAESKKATRIALIEAGLAEMDGQGLDASLDSICERAGLTRGAFYVHFTDREAFIVAVMEHVLGGFVAGLAPVVGQAGGVEKRIQTYFAAVAARQPIVTGGTGLRMHHLLDACRRSKRIGDAYRQLLGAARDRLATLIAVDQTARRIRDDVAATALADFMMIAGLGIPAMLELGLDTSIDVDTLGTTLRALVRRASSQT